MYKQKYINVIFKNNIKIKWCAENTEWKRTTLCLVGVVRHFSFSRGHLFSAHGHLASSPTVSWPQTLLVAPPHHTSSPPSPDLYPLSQRFSFPRGRLASSGNMGCHHWDGVATDNYWVKTRSSSHILTLHGRDTVPPLLLSRELSESECQLSRGWEAWFLKARGHFIRGPGNYPEEVRPLFFLLPPDFVGKIWFSTKPVFPPTVANFLFSVGGPSLSCGASSLALTAAFSGWLVLSFAASGFLFPVPRSCRGIPFCRDVRNRKCVTCSPGVTVSPGHSSPWSLTGRTAGPIRALFCSSRVTLGLAWPSAESGELGFWGEPGTVELNIKEHPPSLHEAVLCGVPLK